MIKFMIHLVKIVITTMVALLFSSCNMNFNSESISGSGKVVTKDRNLTGFTKIELARGLDCEVAQDSNFKVTVEADDNLQEGIITKVENGTLKITSKYGNYRNVKSKKIYVTMPYIDQLEATSASQLTTKGVIKSNKIRLKTSSAADLTAIVESENVALESSSGSDLTVSGKAINLTTQSSSGSDINANELLANNIHSQSSSGSDTNVHPLISFKAQASSGSSIEYIGSPKTKSIQKSSGGSVTEN